MSERACVEGWEDRMFALRFWVFCLLFLFNSLIFPFEEDSHSFCEESLFENQWNHVI